MSKNKMPETFVVVGIGTEIGKTIVSAVLVQAYNADYWKPIQAGLETDTATLRQLVNNSRTKFHNETYFLKNPLSPHAAAALEGIEIIIDELKIPETTNKLVIELAGGLLVPLNQRQTNLDLLKYWNLPVVLVVKNYLGSINHTLLTFDVLAKNNISIAGIVLNGDENKSSEKFILEYTQLPLLGRVPFLPMVTVESIANVALNFDTA